MGLSVKRIEREITMETVLTFDEALRRILEMGISINRARGILAVAKHAGNRKISITSGYSVRAAYDDNEKFVISRPETDAEISQRWAGSGMDAQALRDNGIRD
jgi:hypothetical protein